MNDVLSKEHDWPADKTQIEIEAVRNWRICIECKKWIELHEKSYSFKCKHHIHEACISQGLQSYSNYISMIRDWDCQECN